MRAGRRDRRSSGFLLERAPTWRRNRGAQLRAAVFAELNASSKCIAGRATNWCRMAWLAPSPARFRPGNRARMSSTTDCRWWSLPSGFHVRAMIAARAERSSYPIMSVEFMRTAGVLFIQADAGVVGVP
eukprot:1317382-Prymnesium_polylepis.1